jgi:predicted nucleic acid-binding Zn ribbon protein
LERYRKNAKSAPKEQRKCAYCGAEFIQNRINQRFCKTRCQEAHKRAVRRGEVVAVGISPGMANRSYGTGECVICGEMFTKRSARQMTCSKGCRKIYAAGYNERRQNA